jgi:DNA primase
MQLRAEGVAERTGVCLGDSYQNNRDRIIASAYSLRPIPGAPVSTPMTWDELKDVTDPGAYNLFTVPDRLADGDPWTTIDDEQYSLEPLHEEQQ